MGAFRTPIRAVIVGWLAVAWHQWIAWIAFPFGGGEGHWVMMRVRPLGFSDGVFVGGLSAVAGVGLAVVLTAKRVWVALLVGVAAPGLVAAGAGRLTGPVPDLVLDLGLYGLPWVVVGVVVVLSKVQLGWVGTGVVAWWPAFLHLFWYLGAVALPERFRVGVGLMWVGGGLLVAAVARWRGPGSAR